ncbi:MAG: 50S ribosomal protein L29 [Candidatus Hodarchaeota archaeon]
MATLKKNKIKQMSLDEKRKKLVEYKSELNYQRSLLASGNTTDSPGKIKSLKKTIARLKTFINLELRQQA